MNYFIYRLDTREVIATAATESLAGSVAGACERLLGVDCQVVWYNNYEEPDSAAEDKSC